MSLAVVGSSSLTPAEAGFSPSLLPVAEVAKLLGLSTRTVWRLDSGGILPRPVTLGSSKRWRKEELAAWILASCPPRAKWQWEQLHQSV